MTYRQHGVGVELQPLEGVFAGAGVDAGTRHLLRWLASDRYERARTVLDVGCGYGPLGLWLAAAEPAREVLAIDRDARALEATVLGAAGNGLAGRVEVAGSLGYDDVGDRRFDLIVSNIPAKIGAPALAHLALDARHWLAEGGSVAIVVVARLAGAVAELLADDAVEVLATHPTKAYTAFEYRFVGPPSDPPAASGFDRHLYHRGRSTFGAGALTWEAEVAYSIPEFDTLGHGTIAALDVLPSRPRGLAVLSEVGQGHLALALRAGGGDGPLRLVDRDLLALRTAAANLGAGRGVDARHQGRLRAADLDGASLAAVGLPEREPVAVTAALLGAALQGAGDGLVVVVHGRTADVGRVLELLPRHGARLVESARARHHAHAAVRATVGRSRRRAR